ncbi:MAG: hypothetical protein JWO96_355 [Candidatus Saccharibacteria bacterium]|nr:hypothetical protein [Candidatus Saccharibacteria bacterium]
MRADYRNNKIPVNKTPINHANKNEDKVTSPVKSALLKVAGVGALLIFPVAALAVNESSPPKQNNMSGNAPDQSAAISFDGTLSSQAAVPSGSESPPVTNVSASNSSSGSNSSQNSSSASVSVDNQTFQVSGNQSLEKTVTNGAGTTHISMHSRSGGNSSSSQSSVHIDSNSQTEVNP